MPIKCEDRERILLDGSAEDWAGLELHAASCAECAKELQSWQALGAAAEELRDYQETPALWARIESALAQQAKESASHKPWLERLYFWRNMPMVWQTALAGALVLLMAVTAGYVVLRRHSGVPVDAHNPLLRDTKVAEVERAERDYGPFRRKFALPGPADLSRTAASLKAGVLRIAVPMIVDRRGRQRRIRVTVDT